MNIRDRFRSAWDILMQRRSWSALDDRFFISDYSGPTKAGVTVSEATSLQVIAVYACVNLLASTMASLPLPVYRRLKRGKEKAPEHPLYSLLHDSPNTDQTSYIWRQTSMAHILLWGNLYSEIEFNDQGRPVGLWPLPPWRVKPRRTIINRELFWEVQLPSVTQEEYKRAGNVTYIPDYAMFHVMALGTNGIVGLSPIRLAIEAVGLTMAAQEFGARLFGQGANMGGVVEHPKTLTEQGHRNLEDTLNSNYAGLGKAHRIMLLEEGMKWMRVGINPNEAQFLETRKFQRNDIASLFSIPPHMIGDLERATFSNIEQQSIDFVVNTLRPWLVNWEQEISRKLLKYDYGYYAEFLVDGLLRGDSAARALFYKEMFFMGSMSPNDIREKENMNPVEDGDSYYVPLNMVPVGKVEEPRPTTDDRGMSPDDWKKAYEKDIPHWAMSLDPSLFAQDFVEELKGKGLSGKLLEIGCGNGRDSIFFAKAGFDVTAIDIAPGAIKLAKENAKSAEVKIDFQEASAEELPFDDNTFGAIFSLSVLHATDLPKSIAETARVLKGQGLLFIYIYGDTESVDGTKEDTISVDSFVQLLKGSGYGILDFYSEQQEEYDEAGERHKLLVALAERNK